MNEFWSQYLAGFKSSERDVLKLSDYFNKRQGATPWKQSGMSDAYMAYFFPLNYLRLQYVLSEAQRLQFPMRSILDIGSGPGVAHAALLDLNFSGEYHASEPSDIARELHMHWRKSQGEQKNIFIDSGKLSADQVRGKTGKSFSSRERKGYCQVYRFESQGVGRFGSQDDSCAIGGQLL